MLTRKAEISLGKPCTIKTISLNTMGDCPRRPPSKVNPTTLPWALAASSFRSAEFFALVVLLDASIEIDCEADVGSSFTFRIETVEQIAAEEVLHFGISDLIE